MIADSISFWPINPMLTISPWHIFQLDMVRCLWAFLPPTILWGASFPLACAAAARPGQDPGRTVGGVYAANTLGAILALIPWIGTANSERVILIASAASAVFVLIPRFRQRPSMLGAPLAAAALACAGVLAGNVH